MPKRVTKTIKIIPKIDNKSKRVLFNFKTKKNKNNNVLTNKNQNINSILAKKINLSILKNKLSLLKDSFNLKLSNIKKSKETRSVMYNLKYYFKKVIVLNILKFTRKVVSLFTRKPKSNINLNLFTRKDKNNKKNINIAIITGRVKYFFTPDNKSNWMPEFKNFVVLTLASVFVINILFFSDQVAQDLSKIVATTAYAQEEILSGIDDVKSLNTDVAKNKFYLALSSFYNLKEELNFITKGSFNFIGNFINIKTSDIEEMVGNLEDINQASFRFVDVVELNKDKNFLFKIQKANEFLTIIDKNIKNIDGKISKINTTLLPLEYKNKINTLKSKVSYVSSSSDKILQATTLLRSVLGENEKKRYLLVFQNANEIRANGGFMGSYALVDVKNGDLIKTEVPGGGTYDLSGGFYKNIEPPMPLKLLTDKWEIQDSNWFLDFTKSAKNISEFFETANNGSTVDGVIAINSNSLVDLLKITGDIKLDKYNTTLTQDNVVDELQNIISSNRLKTNKPKEVIVDLFSIVSEKLFNIDNSDVINSISLLDKTIKEKNILAYFSNVNDEKIVKNIGFSGEIINTNQDYLSVVYSNVGASKTSQIIDRNLSQDVKILPTGEVIVSLKINNIYPSNLNISDRNIDYIRVYTPLGSKLISASGFSDDVVIKESIDPYKQQDIDLDPINKYRVRDINTNTITYNDEGKTVFGNFLYLDSGDNKTVEISYKLPFNVDYDKIKNNKSGIYSLFVQSQPGIKNVDFELTVRTPISSLMSEKLILNEDKSFIK